MRFQTREDGLEIVTHIPGPSHNFLGLRFTATEDGQEPQVVKLPPISGAERVDAEVVRSEVLAGIRDAAEETGKFIAVREIQFVPDDSPRAGIYREMARRLAIHLFG